MFPSTEYILMEPGRSCPIKISALFPIWPTVRLSLSGPCVKKNPKYSFTETKGCKYNVFTTCISLILQMTIILSVEVETKEEYNTIQIPLSLSLSLSLSLLYLVVRSRIYGVFDNGVGFWLCIKKIGSQLRMCILYVTSTVIH